MAKKKEEQEAAPSWNDFDEDNLLNDTSEQEEQEEEIEEEDKDSEEEEDDKVKSKSKPKKKDSKSKEEEGESEEEDEEVDEKKKTTSKKASKEDQESQEEEENKEEEEQESEENEEESSDPQKFFEEVEKITGQEIEVDYGDVDPLSPQGVALREKAVREATIENFLAEIEEKFPAAYKALDHAFNGGDIAELFKAAAATRDYTKVEIGEKDQALAKEILREYYQNKGIKNIKRIDAFIETAEESEEGLIAEAKSALEELKTEQAQKADEIVKAQQKIAADQKRRDQTMVSAVDEVLEEGKIGNFKLTGKQEASEFREFVFKNLRRAKEGKYEFATPIESANLEKLLQYQFFQFKKGDLSKLILMKAASENAHKLRLKVKAEQGSNKKGKGTESSDTNKQTSLQDYNV